MVLGMIPDCELAKVTSAGNAAGTGARIALLNAEPGDNDVHPFFGKGQRSGFADAGGASRDERRVAGQLAVGSVDTELQHVVGDRLNVDRRECVRPRLDDVDAERGDGERLRLAERILGDLILGDRQRRAADGRLPGLLLLHQGVLRD